MLDIRSTVYGETINVSLIPTSTYGVISFGGMLQLLSHSSIQHSIVNIVHLCLSLLLLTFSFLHENTLLHNTFMQLSNLWCLSSSLCTPKISNKAIILCLNIHVCTVRSP